MRRYLVSLMATVVIVAMVVIAWTPVAKSGHVVVDGNCLEFCEEQAECQCAKILGGSLRKTVCNIGAQCVYDTVITKDKCICEIDALCKPWEIDIVVQSFPPGNPFQPCNDN